ncbi:MAG: leucine-rich repeat domain-containing protein [Janthinobacterium lividum]
MFKIILTVIFLHVSIISTNNASCEVIYCEENEERISNLFLKLPNEVIFEIVKYLELKDFKNFAILDKTLNEMTRDEIFLKNYLVYASKQPDELKHRLIPIKQNLIVIFGSISGALRDPLFSDLFNDSYFKFKNSIKSDHKSLEFSLLNSNLNILPLEIGELIYLEQLYLSHNRLRELPMEMSQLINLKELTLNNNKLKIFPTCISHLKNLEKLSLVGNFLKSLDPNIHKMKKLQCLLLDNNEISEIPSSIKMLTSLHKVSFHFNKIKEFSHLVEIIQLKFLEYIGLINNPLSDQTRYTIQTMKSNNKMNDVQIIF